LLRYTTSVSSGPHFPASAAEPPRRFRQGRFRTGR